MKLNHALTVVLLAASTLLAGCFTDGAPAVQYTSLSGQQASTDSLKGKVVLVNFWATSCSGCMAEMPKLVATQQKYGAQGYQTVAVAMSYDPPNYVQSYVSDKKLPFFVTLDSQGSIAKAFGDIQLTPTSILIDKQGNIIKRFVGEPNFDELHQLIEQNLKA
ncbi:TlpA family protein disulfide reductase [Vogesella amnigena]|uniref:TlpA family protein disulfide reductase n=1 Tax=Vogesella amnigena TaxID=1507449 RepID=A0ABV7TUP3_9NEIS